MCGRTQREVVGPYAVLVKKEKAPHAEGMGEDLAREHLQFSTKEDDMANSLGSEAGMLTPAKLTICKAKQLLQLGFSGGKYHGEKLILKGEASVGEESKVGIMCRASWDRAEAIKECCCPVSKREKRKRRKRRDVAYVRKH